MRSDTRTVITPVGPHAPALGADFELRGRIRAEYIEMPGLTLTLLQAARLFGVDAPRCAHALDALVRDGYLACRGRSYMRAR
jgi:hypothetical protein